MTETCAVLSAAGHCAPDEADAYAQMHAKGVVMYHTKLWNGMADGRKRYTTSQHPVTRGAYLYRRQVL